MLIEKGYSEQKRLQKFRFVEGNSNAKIFRTNRAQQQKISGDLKAGGDCAMQNKLIAYGIKTAGNCRDC